jgi:tetratricopeptide (TPR) repeat protein
LRRVAAGALQRGAPAAAAAWLRRALVEPPPPASRAAVPLELGSAELRVAAPGAVDHLAAAVELLREPRLLASSVRWLASALTMSGAADRAVEAIESAIEVVEAEDRELALLLVAELVSHAQEASLETRTTAASRLERYGDLGGATPGERLVLAVLNFQRARASESATDAAGFLERGLADGRLLGEQEPDAAGPFYLLMVGLLATDALDLADACLEQALVDAHARSSIPAIAFVIEFRGWVSLRRGDVAQAEADARMALHLLTAHDIQLGTAFALGLLIEALLEQGETEAAERALRGSGPGQEILPGLATSDLLEARGLLRLAQGRLREGVDDLLEFGRRDELWGGANPLATRWRSRASRSPPWETAWGRARWLVMTFGGRGAGERPAGSAWRCAPPRWSRAARGLSAGCARPPRCWRARRHGSSMPARSPTWVPPCGVATAAPRRAARSSPGSTSPGAAAPVRLPSGPAPSCAPPGAGRASCSAPGRGS